jgi:hypothetical protein
MNKLEKTIEHGIASLKALREEPTEGNSHKIIEEIKALNNIDVSGLKKHADDGCGHCSSGVDCDPSCENWTINNSVEDVIESFVIYFHIKATDDEDAKLTALSVFDQEGNEIELNKGELFWIEKAIQDKLAY